MTVEKIKFRLPPSMLTAVSAAPFQCHYEARVDRPLDDLDLDEVFLNVQGNLMPGDSVTVCAFADQSWKHLMEVGHARIVCKGPEAIGGPSLIRAVWAGEIFKVPQRGPIKVTDKPRKLDVKKQFGGGYHVVDEKGNVIEAFKTLAEADAYVARLAGNEPKPEAAKAPPKAKEPAAA